MKISWNTVRASTSRRGVTAPQAEVAADRGGQDRVGEPADDLDPVEAGEQLLGALRLSQWSASKSQPSIASWTALRSRSAPVRRRGRARRDRRALHLCRYGIPKLRPCRSASTASP